MSKLSQKIINLDNLSDKIDFFFKTLIIDLKDRVFRLHKNTVTFCEIGIPKAMLGKYSNHVRINIESLDIIKIFLFLTQSIMSLRGRTCKN